MIITITDFCDEVNNWFEQYKLMGEFEIKNNSLDVSEYGIKEGQYIRIVGSALNDGVYPCAYGTIHNLIDEVFDGAIWAMAVPSSVIAQITDINQWLEKNAKAIDSPYQSESFAGYSYTKPSGESSLSWQSHFKNILNRWRKI